MRGLGICKNKTGMALFFTGQNRLKVFFLLLFLLLMFACASFHSQNQGDICSLHWTEDGNTPKTAVVLPFENHTPEKDVENLIRKSFYNHFSSKNYYDLELSEVDGVLKTLQSTSSQTWKDLSPSSLAALFHADFIIYGSVEEFEKKFLGIYSQIALKVALEIVDGRNEDVVFKKTIVRRSHEGGLPFSLFGIIPAAMRSGLHMKKERTLALIDRINRDLVAQIPDPPCPPVAPFIIEIQVASFKEKKRALQTLKELEGRGLKPRTEAVTLGDHLWHRILLGPYYKVSEAERIRSTVAQNTLLLEKCVCGANCTVLHSSAQFLHNCR